MASSQVLLKFNSPYSFFGLPPRSPLARDVRVFRCEDIEPRQAGQ